MSDELLHGFVECLDSDDVEEETTTEYEEEKGMTCAFNFVGYSFELADLALLLSTSNVFKEKKKENTYLLALLPFSGRGHKIVHKG